MSSHDHWCSECDLDWECHDGECAGVSAMPCDGCEYEEDDGPILNLSYAV